MASGTCRLERTGGETMRSCRDRSKRGLVRCNRQLARRLALRVLAVTLLAVCPMLVGGGPGPGGFGSVGPSGGFLGEARASDAVGRTYGDTDGDVVLDGSVAPGWPFRGVLNYVSHRVMGESVSGRSSWHYWSADTGEWDRDFLQYWDVESETLYEVPMGPTIPGCAGTPLVYDGYVEFHSFNSNSYLNWTVLRVPWGDDAYPHLVRTETVSQPYGGFGPFLDGDLHLSYSGDRLRVATAAGEAFYFTSSSDAYPSGTNQTGSGETGLFLSDAGPENADSADEGMWDPIAEFDGSDGRHYGFSVIHAEPACVAEDSFIVAGDTGEVVACGWRYGGGPRLTEPEGSQPRSGVLALPQATVGIDCDKPPDLRDLAAPDGTAGLTPETARPRAIDGRTAASEVSTGGFAEEL